ncbi:alpha/beta hydrolase [Acinetobacter qingfengensis]|uniref:AB hydrolase-1 domain-containing protein n=1 Tax=Acinetobacter qingfengensis TaxID=1262585 RepID=A0A1E7QYW4_9GAMM|nr:alpha/beta hydrolase [Acinetobacter qingfengensis]KAA8733138.1 alpha/beta hydrolase [Acinetobacter qingfengensis]OEY92288.1 hypothetical protein BJI46_05965 [Acinetobacter qingfengensis]
MYQFDHQSGKFIQTESANFYVEQHSSSDKRTIVFLHGGLGNIVDLNPIVNSLSADFHIVGIDFAGHGRSTYQDDYSFSYAQHQADVEYILAKLNIHQYTIIGFSDGGIVAYRLAAQHSDQVQQIITIGAQWQLEAQSLNILKSLTAKQWLTMFPESVTYYQQINAEPNFDKLVYRVVNHLWTDQSETGYPNRMLNLIKCPVLAMRGDQDHLLSLEELTALSKVLPKADIANIPYAGHALYEDDLQTCITLIQKALSRI